MKANKEEIVDKICDIIAEDDYTITEICDMVGIHRDTYYAWKADSSDISDRFKAAEQRRMEVFRKAARSGLLTLLTGKEFEEVTEFYSGKGKDKKLQFRKVVKKFLLPNPGSVALALKSLDKENFKEIVNQQIEGEIKITRNIIFKSRGTTEPKTDEQS